MACGALRQETDLRFVVIDGEVLDFYGSIGVEALHGVNRLQGVLHDVATLHIPKAILGALQHFLLLRIETCAFKRSLSFQQGFYQFGLVLEVIKIGS